jgi:hypothetical protein
MGKQTQGKTEMIWKNLLLMKFDNGFRILSEKDTDDKFYVVDDIEIEVGDVFRVGPNGYFERIGNTDKDVAQAEEVYENAVA